MRGRAEGETRETEIDEGDRETEVETREKRNGKRCPEGKREGEGELDRRSEKEWWRNV